jgi:hypothetical protein
MDPESRSVTPLVPPGAGYLQRYYTNSIDGLLATVSKRCVSEAARGLPRCSSVLFDVARVTSKHSRWWPVPAPSLSAMQCVVLGGMRVSARIGSA